MFRKILVPLDRTRFAEAALPHAMYLAKRHGAELLLATVWLPAPISDKDSPADREIWRWEQDCREDDRRYMGAVAAKVEAACGQKVAIRYLLGDPGEALANLAAGGEVDLAVVSTHARGPLKRALLRSVADRLARRGGIPVLLVHAEASSQDVQLEGGPPFHHVLVPMDGSPLSEAALHPSLLASLPSHTSEITLLHVAPLPASMTTPAPPTTLEFGRRTREESIDAEQYLARIADQLGAWGCRVNTRVVASPSTARAILDFAASNGVDLIAMATHGRGGVARALLGSVADAVVRGSHIPTLLFPPGRPAPDRETSKREREPAEW